MKEDPFNLIEQAIKASLTLQNLSDENFIAFVRQQEELHPDWMATIPWNDRVRQETELRLLSKLNQILIK